MGDQHTQNRLPIKIKKFSSLLGTLCPNPTYATTGSAGMDVGACISEPITIVPGDRQKIPTGFGVQLPSSDWVALMFPRSGLASKFGINMANCVGVIDSDYTGEIQCVLQNNHDQPFTIHPGDRIGQLVFVPILQAELHWVDELKSTQRGGGGFGSTGA